MNVITLTEFRAEPSRWIELAHEGHPITLTKHGEPYAVISAPEAPVTTPQASPPPAPGTDTPGEVPVRRLRDGLADILNATCVHGQTHYITNHGRRVAAIVPLSVADATPPAVEEDPEESPPPVLHFGA